MTLLVTGGAGFIGVHVVRELLRGDPAARVVVLDKLTYAADPRALAELEADDRVSVVRGDIADRALVRELLDRTRPSSVVHLAAETDVDRSIDDPEDFIHTNVVGTFRLIDEVRQYLDRAAPPDLRFLHVSTDEVFGALGADGTFVETTPYAPRSPYAASKAASDHLVHAYLHTHGVPALISHCSNNYGPYQHREKLVPLVITNALAGRPLPVYGAGTNVRDWIHVTDHAAALRAILERGRVGERYLVGARTERRNLDVVQAICDLLDELRPRATPHRDLIEHVVDRKGHDFRYAIDPTKLESELGWRPATTFDDGLRSTVRSYLD